MAAAIQCLTALKSRIKSAFNADPQGEPMNAKLFGPTAMAVLLLARSVSAEVINLRCDPLRGDSNNGLLFITVDTVNMSVHSGRSNDHGWFANNGTALDVENHPPAFMEWSKDWHRCTFRLKQYVKIDDETISYGATG